MENKSAELQNNTSKIALVAEDSWLEPYEGAIAYRLKRYSDIQNQIKATYGSLYDFASLHKELGFQYNNEEKGWYYKEWVPQAYSVHLIGDFNNWNVTKNPLSRNREGVWSVFLPDSVYGDSFKHQGKVKVRIESRLGTFDRIPALITRAVQDEESKDFSGQVWFPPNEYNWEGDNFDLSKIEAPLIYECHIGMGQEKEGLGTYTEFKEKILPRIKALGYNTIQIMAIQEHPYYGSFGYHVSSFFAPSSRFGTPEDLKDLIKEAHRLGIAVIMDIVHSHAVKNLLEGLNEFDGTDHQYFHPGGRGHHPSWDSKLFNYGNWNVIQFLLSNVRYWLEEFHFDGYRFDGVTSMMYHHHGSTTFGDLGKYFDSDVDGEALLYLQLANTLIHEIKPNAMSIAEDVSGMPGLSRKVEEGGLGFDYRLGMGIPDYWIKLLKDKSDDDWNVHDMWHTMMNRRMDEKTIAYCESHDQALVGDKTIAFRLMDKEMYEFMRVSDQNLVIDRGMALHKLIRMFTISLGGEGYLNFMGNEFGHPEWIDFPREGNNWSYQYARRQWSLPENGLLKYQFLEAFDKAMIKLVSEHNLLEKDSLTEQLNMDENNNTVVFAKKGLVFLFNFHPSNSIPNYQFLVKESGEYKIILNSDSPRFGGHNRIDDSITYLTDKVGKLTLYNTNRTVLVLKKIN